jgi:DNA-binding CsgD family transcriptional regulator
MIRLRSSDYRSALQAVQAIAQAADDVAAFARSGVELLPELVASELTTLSICDLASGRRAVVSTPGCRIDALDRAAFDRHFREHPLVRFHGYDGGRVAWRISDSVPFARFRNTALYDEYYRRVGLDHALALPLYVDARWLVSFVFNRKGRDFSERDRAMLDLACGALGALYRRALALAQLRSAAADLRDLLGQAMAGIDLPGAPARRIETPPVALPLTPREREVLRWVAAGKTDRDIAAILGISPRTVHKHLQHVYEKLGVETRTAAAMRALTWH